jgi:hypothetical protein
MKKLYLTGMAILAILFTEAGYASRNIPAERLKLLRPLEIWSVTEWDKYKGGKGPNDNLAKVTKGKIDAAFAACLGPDSLTSPSCGNAITQASIFLDRFRSQIEMAPPSKASNLPAAAPTAAQQAAIDEFMKKAEGYARTTSQGEPSVGGSLVGPMPAQKPKGKAMAERAELKDPRNLKQDQMRANARPGVQAEKDARAQAAKKLVQEARPALGGAASVKAGAGKVAEKSKKAEPVPEVPGSSLGKQSGNQPLTKK